MWHYSRSYTIFALLFSACVSWRGHRKSSLSASGAVAACAVGSVHLLAGPQFGLTLIVFFLTSSKLTKLKSNVKAKVEDNFQYGGRRNATQVLVNSLGGAVFAVATALQAMDVPYLQFAKPAVLMGGFLGHYACCCADTWASEVGVLSKGLPRLVTTFQPVPRGTNGGVSRLGTLSGIAGSLLIGMTFWLASFLTSAKGATLSVLPCLVIALFGGLVGNFADSVLGSTLQYSGCSQSTGRVVSVPGPGIDHICGHPVFSNSQVNLVSSLITSALTGCFACVVY